MLGDFAHYILFSRHNLGGHSLCAPLFLGIEPNAWLTGTGSRRLEGTNSGHKNAEGMPAVGVRVEPPVRLGRVGTVVQVHECLNFRAYANAVLVGIEEMGCSFGEMIENT